MSKQEIRRESKEAEGNPQVKGRVRQIQRAMARRRMINDVARATVVITNPTHYAIALKYQRGSMAAPLVLAKGADHLAAAIRKKARDHSIPIVENKPLAQALYKTAEVGQMIPAQLFAAVAEVLVSGRIALEDVEALTWLRAEGVLAPPRFVPITGLGEQVTD